MEDTDQVVLATVEDFHSGSVFLQRLHAPPHIKNLTVEVENAKFEKLAVAVGNVLNPGEDLVLLEDVSDATILHTLRLRLGQGKIFTSIGPVLVVVNPYQPVECCNDKTLKRLTDEVPPPPLSPTPHPYRRPRRRPLPYPLRPPSPPCHAPPPIPLRARAARADDRVSRQGVAALPQDGG